MKLQHQVQEAAYFHWKARGRPIGSALVDWLFAEAQIAGTSSTGAARSSDGLQIELPEYLANLYEREGAVHLKSLESIFRMPEFRIFTNSIALAQSVLSGLACRENESDLGRWVVSYLGLRIYNSVASAFRLAIHGYNQTARMVIRDVVEVSFLIRYFYLAPEKIEIWHNGDNEVRKKEFGPDKVRMETAKLAAKLEAGVDERTEQETMKKMYAKLCREAAHADPEGLYLVYHDGALQFGPIDDPEMLKITLFEIAKWSQYATLQVIAHLVASNVDPVLREDIKDFFKQYGEWIKFASAHQAQSI